MMERKIPATARIALALTQHRIAVALNFSVITAAVLALYSQDLSMVFTGALTNESTYHILAIPFLFGYLLYRKRKMINASLDSKEAGARGFQKYFSTLAGASLCAVAVLAYWYGSYTFTPLEYHMLTLPLLVAGLVLILFGTQTLKQLVFPIAFLIFLTPPPDEILYTLGSALANLCASASNSLANLFGMHATLSLSNTGSIITLIIPSHAPLSFNVDVACSGIYSIIGFSIFAIFIAYITAGRLANKFAILVMGIPLIIALNIIRITAILAIGFDVGENLALTLFHDVGATVLMFIGTFVLLIVTEKVFKKPKPPPPCSACNPKLVNRAQPFCATCGKLFKYPKINISRADIARIIGVAVIVIMLLSIQAPVFALTQGPAQVMTQTPSGTQISTVANTANSVFPNIQGYKLSYSYRDTAFEQESGDDAALVYCYSSQNANTPTVWVALEIASSVTSEHQWETCLINFPLSQGDQATVRQLDLRDIQLESNPPMTARYFAFQYINDNQTQIVLYWYETAVFDTNSTAQTKSVMISLIAYPSKGQSLPKVENDELPVAQAINSYWQPIQTWTTIALALSQNGLALSGGAAAIFVLLVLYEVYTNRREKHALQTLYKKLSAQDQLLIKAVNNVKNATTQAVTMEFQKLSSIPVSESYITLKLNEAEKAGLIKKALVSENDNPFLIWKKPSL
jgi:exosortase